MSPEDRYKNAGVDIEKGNQFVSNIRDLVRSTHGPQVLSGLGGFSGMFALESSHMKSPTLVSSTDGVGTKLKIAFLMDKHDTVGQDLVGMVVNDIAVMGAKPLFMLDYMATGKLELGTAEAVVKGIVEGCKLAECALIGGETAEMPGFYGPGEYDLAGFTVGLIDREAMVDGSNIKPGDALIGLGSSGLHSNGYSLVRRIVFEEQKLKVDSRVEGLARSVGEELLEPTKIYVKPIRQLMEKFTLLGAAHITGGGVLENVPRMLPDNCKAVMKQSAWPVPPVFEFLQKAGGLDRREMHRTFNHGLGMVLAVDSGQADAVLDLLLKKGHQAQLVGEIVSRKDGEEQAEVLV
jgi:phosphoribosylformylglycinamidine cyclo-ligase